MDSRDAEPQVQTRLSFLQALDELATAVAARHPGARVGFSASAIDSDWCVYLNGPGVIFGHDAEDIAMALNDLDRMDFETPSYYNKDN